MLFLMIDQKLLLEYMKEANIEDLFERFKRKGIKSEDLWFIPDSVLLKDISLSQEEKLRYDTMKAKHFKGKESK